MYPNPPFYPVLGGKGVDLLPRVSYDQLRLGTEAYHAPICSISHIASRTVRRPGPVPPVMETRTTIITTQV